MILNILEELSNEPGTNNKIAILGKYKDNETLKQVLYKGMSKRVKFWTKTIPDTIATDGTLTLEAALLKLENLENRKVTGNNASLYIAMLLGHLNDNDAEVIKRIIKKKLNIGMGRTNVNKVYKNLIEKTAYMRCKSFSEDVLKNILVLGPAYAQVKMDGRYLNGIVRSGDTELVSRNGEPSFLEGTQFEADMKKFPDCVLNGELTIDSKTRYESNGIIASLISIGKKAAAGKSVVKEITKFNQKHGNYSDMLSNVRLTVWDILDIDEYYRNVSTTPYSARYKRLEIMLKQFKPKNVSLVKTWEVNSYEEVMALFQQNLNAGEEGLVVKLASGAWKDGTPAWQCKMKLELEVDLEVIGFNYGNEDTKNADVISSLTAATSDGLLITRPGGITESWMDYITKNQSALQGSIVIVKCSGISKNSDGSYSLMHPRFQRFRDDKDIADTLPEVQKIQDMILGLTSKGE